MDRSQQFRDGYRNAAKEAISWLHRRGKEMNDPHAKQILDAAAFNLGGHFSRAARIDAALFSDDATSRAMERL